MLHDGGVMTAPSLRSPSDRFNRETFHVPTSVYSVFAAPSTRERDGLTDT